MSSHRSKQISNHDRITPAPSPATSSSEIIDQVDALFGKAAKCEPADQIDEVGVEMLHSDVNPPERTQFFDQRLSEISAQIESRLDQFLIGLDTKFNRLLEKLESEKCAAAKTDSKYSNLEPSILDAEAGEMAVGQPDATLLKHSQFEESSPDQILSEWDRRKREMLAEYGVASDEIEKQTPVNSSVNQFAVQLGYEANKVASKKGSDNSDSYRPPRLGDSEEGPALDALHDSIAQLDKIDVVEIESLKEQLTSKLRDAEVELSINRAKLSQRWAALEQKQCEISQREASLESKYGDLTGAPKKTGMLDRFARHLSRGGQE